MNFFCISSKELKQFETVKILWVISKSLENVLIFNVSLPFLCMYVLYYLFTDRCISFMHFHNHCLFIKNPLPMPMLTSVVLKVKKIILIQDISSLSGNIFTMWLFIQALCEEVVTIGGKCCNICQYVLRKRRGIFMYDETS